MKVPAKTELLFTGLQYFIGRYKYHTRIIHHGTPAYLRIVVSRKEYLNIRANRVRQRYKKVPIIHCVHLNNQHLTCNGNALCKATNHYRNNLIKEQNSKYSGSYFHPSNISIASSKFSVERLVDW